MGLPVTASERRQSPRTAVQDFAYINIEANNGGSVLNVSEGGLCFHSIAPVRRNGTIRFWVSERNRRIEAAGKLAWTDETQKTGGVQFTALPAGAREQIRKWISQSAMSLSANKAPAQPFPSLPAFLTPGTSFPETRTIPENPAPLVESSPEAKESAPRSGFSRGLATGLLVSTLIAAVFFFRDYRRELGESLIHLGERFAAKPQEQQEPMEAVTPPAPQAVTPAPPTMSPAPQTVSPAPPAIPPVSQAAMSAPRTVPAAPQNLPPASQTVPPVPKTVVSTPQTVSPTPQRVASEPAPIPVPPSENVLPQPLANPAPPQQAKLDATVPASATLTAAGGSVPEASAAPANSSPPTAPSLPAMTVTTDSGRTAGKLGTAPQVELASHSGRGTGEENAISEMFFEVGRFKDQSRAHRATDQLAQFGFPANVVEKGHLWRSSYDVLVGPFPDDERAQTAHQNLLSRGFKPRPFERGSHILTLRPGLTLNGTRLDGGECLISWESYISDATVKFEHNNYLVATAGGKWVRRAIKYGNDAFVYRKNGDGSRTLLEIRFAGMSRALVFGPV